MFSPRVGTPIYRAPEMIQRGQMYSESIDLWSAGCCIYFMLVGQPPFKEVVEVRELNEKIKEGSFDKNRDRYKRLSVNAKNLICGLMHKDVLQRLSA